MYLISINFLMHYSKIKYYKKLSYIYCAIIDQIILLKTTMCYKGEKKSATTNIIAHIGACSNDESIWKCQIIAVVFCILGIILVLYLLWQSFAKIIKIQSRDLAIADPTRDTYCIFSLHLMALT